jgi:hypothetical protein
VILTADQTTEITMERNRSTRRAADEPFAKVPRFVTDSCRREAMAERTWTVLRHLADHRTGRIDRPLGLDEIAGKVGCSTRTAQRATAQLERLGLLHRYRRRYPAGDLKGRFGRYRYRLTLEVPKMARPEQVPNLAPQFSERELTPIVHVTL